MVRELRATKEEKLKKCNVIEAGNCPLSKLISKLGSVEFSFLAKLAVTAALSTSKINRKIFRHLTLYKLCKALENFGNFQQFF